MDIGEQWTMVDKGQWWTMVDNGQLTMVDNVRQWKMVDNGQWWYSRSEPYLLVLVKFFVVYLS